jgi:SAM-dependent methyltransferase
MNPLQTPPPEGKLLDANEYAQRHDDHIDFEEVCLEARLQCNLRILQRLQPRRVLEVGCGPVLLAERAWAQGLLPERWTVVEPAHRYAQKARDWAAGRPEVVVIENYIEHAQLAEADGLPTEAPCCDLVIVSGVIHETQAPEALLAAALAHLASGGRLLVTVPNAHSFHRLLAVEMGLIAATTEVTERNRLFGQPKVYRAEDLRELMTQLGLVEESLEGYLFKPFTHPQMAGLLGGMPANAAQALIDLGRQFPAQAAEICIVALRP